MAAFIRPLVVRPASSHKPTHVLNNTPPRLSLGRAATVGRSSTLYQFVETTMSHVLPAYLTLLLRRDTSDMGSFFADIESVDEASPEPKWCTVNTSSGVYTLDLVAQRVLLRSRDNRSVIAKICPIDTCAKDMICSSLQVYKKLESRLRYAGVGVSNM